MTKIAAGRVKAALAENNLIPAYAIIDASELHTQVRWFGREEQARFRALAQKALERYADMPTDGRGGHILPWLLAYEDVAEEMGMHADDRLTCHTCRNWADHQHTPAELDRLARVG